MVVQPGQRRYGGGELERLLEEYRETLRLAERMREKGPEEDQKIYAGMITSLQYAIKWLRDDQQPAPKKSRDVTWDPEWEEFSDHHIDPYSSNNFDEIDRKIDTERKMQRA